MKVILILVFLLAFPALAQSDPWMKVGYVALGAVTAADLETTGRSIERGLEEKNPLYRPFVQQPGLLGLVNGAVSGAIGVGAYKLHKKGKTTEARILIWGWTALRAAVVVHNIRVLRR